MKNFMKAALIKLRFNTVQGVVSSEHLFDMDLPVLNDLVIKLKELAKEAPDAGYITQAASSPEHELAKLRFEIAEEIILYRVAQKNRAATLVENRKRQAEIMAVVDEIDAKNLKKTDRSKLLAMAAELEVE